MSDHIKSRTKSEIEQIQNPLLSNLAFHVNPESLPSPLQTVAWCILDLLEKVAKERKEVFRECLMERAVEEGALTEKGGYTLEIEHTEVRREKRVSKLPEDEPLRELLAKSGIPYTEVFDEVKTLQINPSKLDFLVKTGRLSQTDVEACHPVTYALCVKPSEEIKRLQDEARKVICKPKKKLAK